MAEKDLVWDELELDDLLDLGRQVIDDHRASERAPGVDAKLSKAEIKQHKLLKKPGYNILVERYSSLPTRPKVVTKERLSQLADPVLGRLTRTEKEKFQGLLSRKQQIDAALATLESRKVVLDEDIRVAYQNSKARASLNPLEDLEAMAKERPRRARAEGGGFFMTEAVAEEGSVDDEGSAERRRAGKAKNAAIGRNIRNSKNSFASNFRSRVSDAKKISKLSKPLKLHNGQNEEDESVRRQEVVEAYKQRMEQIKKANKEIYLRNKAQSQKAANRRAAGLDSSLSDQSLENNPREKRISKGAFRDPKTGRVKKAKGSGYGKLVQRFSNQPKARNPKAVNKSIESISDGRLAAKKGGQSVSSSTASAAPSSTFLTAEESSSSPRKSMQKKPRQLGAIPEDPIAEAATLEAQLGPNRKKKLSSSSAPHLRRQSSNAKSAANAAADNASSNQQSSVDASNDGRRSIRSAEAVRKARLANLGVAESEESVGVKVVYPVSLPPAVRDVIESARQQNSVKSPRKAPSTQNGSYAMKRSPNKAVISPPKKPTQPQEVFVQEAAAGAPQKHRSPGPAVVEPLTDGFGPTASIAALRSQIQEDERRAAEDIAASISKLQQHEKAVVPGDFGTKPDINATMARRAERLGGHLHAAEAILREYEAMNLE